MPKQTPMKYEIQARGYLDGSWTEWFEGFSITHPDEQTTLFVGQPKDQAQLYAVLIKIRDLNLILLSVTSIQDVQGEA